MILIRSIQEKSYKNVNVYVNIIVLHQMLPMMGRKIKVMIKGGNKLLLDTQDTQMANEMEDSQSSASSNRVTTPPSLTPCRRPTPGKRMYYGPKKRDAIKEKLLKIIEKPEKQPDEDEIFCLYLAASLRKSQDPQRKEYTKLQL